MSREDSKRQSFRKFLSAFLLGLAFGLFILYLDGFELAPLEALTRFLELWLQVFRSPDSLPELREAWKRTLQVLLPASLLFILASRIVRAHLAAIFCCRPRDSLEYSFHWSFYHEPPFRRRVPLRQEPRIACDRCDREMCMDESIFTRSTSISTPEDLCSECFDTLGRGKGVDEQAVEQGGFTKLWVRERCAQMEPEDWALPDGTAPLAELPSCFLPRERQPIAASRRQTTGVELAPHPHALV